jgi:hypothetical protein
MVVFRFLAAPASSSQEEGELEMKLRLAESDSCKNYFSFMNSICLIFLQSPVERYRKPIGSASRNSMHKWMIDSSQNS